MYEPSPQRPVHRAAIGSLAILAILAVTIGACTQSTSPPPPSSPIASPPASTVPSGASSAPTASSVDSPEAAAAAVLASDPRFAGLKAKDPDLIGQCCFYTATPAADGYAVTIEIGWGDCPAGCIDRHHWFYRVSPDGAIRLDREDGPEVPVGIPGSGDGTTGGVPGIRGTATAGPVCPVARPDDPNCANRPVAGAIIHVIDATGTEVATLETDRAGAFVVSLPPGRYRLVADAVPGAMRTAPAADVTVAGGLASVELVYDTGIR